MKRVIAESYYEIGDLEEGERLFQKYTKMYPTIGWGWINWSDMYWIFAKDKNKDKDRAIRILKEGLEIDNVQDRDAFYERLIEIYKNCNMLDEMAVAEQNLRKENENQRHFLVQPSKNIEPFVNKLKKPEQKSKKVGRNDPSPCGSGNKYKKCCGV